MPDEMIPGEPISEYQSPQTQFTFVNSSSIRLTVDTTGYATPQIGIYNAGFYSTGGIDFGFGAAQTAYIYGGTSGNTGQFVLGGGGTGAFTAATAIVIGSGASTGTITICGNNSIFAYAPTTPEQIAAMNEQQAKWAVEVEARRKKEKVAEAKATRLLRSTVGRSQYALYRKRGHFEIVGQSGRRYRFRKNQRVQIMAENFGDKVDYELCIVSAQVYVPPTDMLITLMMLVLSGEAGEKIMHEKGNRRAA